MVTLPSKAKRPPPLRRKVAEGDHHHGQTACAPAYALRKPDTAKIPRNGGARREYTRRTQRTGAPPVQSPVRLAALRLLSGTVTFTGPTPCYRCRKTRSMFRARFLGEARAPCSGGASSPYPRRGGYFYTNSCIYMQTLLTSLRKGGIIVPVSRIFQGGN
jgi:hypothetical protein